MTFLGFFNFVPTYFSLFVMITHFITYYVNILNDSNLEDFITNVMCSFPCSFYLDV